MRKIIEFIPYELQGIKDYQEIGNAIDDYHAEKIEELNKQKLNRDILTADEETIARYEKLCNITPSATATLEERRYAVWVQRTIQTPYTEQWLRHWLTSLTGSDQYKLDFDYQGKGFVLKITLSNEKNYNTIAALLDEVVPAHLMYILSYLFNDWQRAYEKHTWETASEYTWEEASKGEDF